MNTTYVDWWVREETDEGAFGDKKYVDVSGHHDELYEYFTAGTAGRRGVAPIPGCFGMTFDRLKSANSGVAKKNVRYE